MSGVNISILEGGKAENFGQVTKLRTSNGTDHDSWVPKSDVETKHLSVKKNGLHYTNQYEPTASEKKDGKFHDIYGWDTITVSVKKKVTGIKPVSSGGDGNEYFVEVEDGDGEGGGDGNNPTIVETVLPSSIHITTEPSKTEYNDGETIDINGMVVKAYKNDGNLWTSSDYPDGTIPNSQIAIDPKIASAQGGGDYRSKDGINAIVIPVYEYNTNTYQKYYRSQAPVKEGGIYLCSRFGPCRIALTKMGGYIHAAYEFPELEAEHTIIFSSTSGGFGSVDTNKFFKRMATRTDDFLIDIPVSTVSPVGKEVPPASSTAIVTASWARPKDEEILEDTFYITVTPSNENNGGGGR